MDKEIKIAVKTEVAEYVCKECSEKIDEINEFEGDTYCDDCIDEVSFECYSCNDRFDTDDLEYEDCGDCYCADCFNEHFAYCDNCGEVVQRDYCSYHRDNPVCECCYDDLQVNHEDFDSRPLSLEKNTFKSIKSERCFGIELEIDDDNIDTYKMCQEVTHFGCYDDLGVGMEFYSPIMQGDIGYKEVVDFCKNIGDVTVTEIAGYHIHIDTRDLAKDNNWKAIQRIWYLYSNIEPLIYALVDYSRRDNDYCYPQYFNTDKGSKIIEECKSGEDLVNNMFKSGNSGKFKGLHIGGWKGRKTIELRYHHGTADFDEITNWIKFNLSLFEFAINSPIEGIKELLNFDESDTDLDKIQYIVNVISDDKKLVEFYTKQYHKFEE